MGDITWRTRWNNELGVIKSFEFSDPRELNSVAARLLTQQVEIQVFSNQILLSKDYPVGEILRSVTEALAAN